jgi:transcriptional regulator with XRE-family HTH domain
MRRQCDATDRYVGKRIRLFRLVKDWSQTQLAAGLDLSFQQIQKYENGSNRVSIGSLVLIAKALGRPLAGFLPAENPTETDALLDLVDTSESLRLLQAFNRVHDVTTRAAVLDLVERMTVKAAMPRPSEVSLGRGEPTG